MSASLINLMAASVATVGVITPLVGLVYGSHFMDGIAPMTVAVAILYLFVLVWGLHGLALLTLRRLIE